MTKLLSIKATTACCLVIMVLMLMVLDFSFGKINISMENSIQQAQHSAKAHKRNEFNTQGWYQAHGNTKRDRYHTDIYSRPPPINYYSELNFIPGTVMYNSKLRWIVGLSLEENGTESLRMLGRDGTMNASIGIPYYYERVTEILPVMDNDGAVYTVRRNATGGNMFVLKTVIDEGNFVMPDSISRNGPILDIILAESGLIMVTNGVVKCLNDFGRMVWFHHYDFIQDQAQLMMYDVLGNIVYVLSTKGLAAIDYRNGGLLDMTSFTIEISTSTYFLKMGDYIVVFAKKDSMSNILIFDSGKLKKGIISSTIFKNSRGVAISFDLCSNFLSKESNDIYTLCKLPIGGDRFDWTMFSYRFNIFNNQIEFYKEVPLRTLARPNPKQCSMQIATAIGVAVLCDSSQYTFLQDLDCLYAEVKIDILPETQVISTPNYIIVMTRIDDYAVVQYM